MFSDSGQIRNHFFVEGEKKKVFRFRPESETFSFEGENKCFQIQARFGNIFFEGEKTGTQQTTTLGLIKTMRLPRLLRLIKIMRVLRISKLAKSRPEVLWWVLYSKHANVFSLIFQFVALLLITHYMTCLFYWANTNDNGTSWFDFEECGHPVDDIIQTPPAQDVTEHVRPIIIMDAQSTPV